MTLRAVVPNTPKSSDLSLSDAKFQQMVTLTGTKTVGELMARIAAKTHTELYADPHYASRALTMIGPMSEAPASDVLAALALAVAGAYRQVGPAYVLTDDLEGVGTRRKRLQNWEDATRTQSGDLGDHAGAALLKRRISEARTLPTFGDPTAITPEQMAGLKDDTTVPGVPSEDEHYPFAKLVPAQKNQVREIAEAYEDQQATRPASSDDDPPQEPDPTGAVDLIPEYKVQMLVPTVNGPVETRLQIWAFSLFWPGLAAVESMQAQRAVTAPTDTRPPAPPLLPLLRSCPRRAVVGHPRTPAAVDALISAMQKIGLNELWLDVFSEGKSRLADKDTKGMDILTEALKQTQGTGITVYADISLLPWGDKPPKDTWDLDILGQDSRTAAIAEHDRSGGNDQNYDAAGQPIAYVPPPVFVSPASPQVQKELADTVRGLASRSGLAGFVWEDSERGDELGYTLPMRMAFLRAFHTDPVDITLKDYPRADVSLPMFDDKAVDATLTKKWNDARLGANGFFLTQLRQAVPAASGKPILINLGGKDIPLLVSWDDPRLLPPPLRTLFSGGDDPSPEQVVSGISKQGRSVLIRVPVKDPANTDTLARDLQEVLTLPTPQGTTKGKAVWNGYVLDFRDNSFTDSTDPLRDLVRAVGP